TGVQGPSSTFALLRAFAVVLAVALLTAGTARAVVHLHDLSGISHIAGIWVTLAQYANGGVLYPPLEADGVYAGTRYMPLLFGLVAGLARVAGDYLAAVKLSALLLVGLLLAGVFVAGRRITGRASSGLVLAGLVLAFPEGVGALLSPHSDALAAALT